MSGLMADLRRRLSRRDSYLLALVVGTLIDGYGRTRGHQWLTRRAG